MSKFTVDELVGAVNSHAKKMFIENPDSDWGAWVEVMDPAAKEAAVKGARSVNGAIKRAVEGFKADLSTKAGSVISKAQKAAYGKEANNGDVFAKALKTAVTDHDTLIEVANENGIDGSRWDHLNFGMQRMNLGNVLRGMVKNNEMPVSIGGAEVS